MAVILDSLLYGGIHFVLDKLAAAVDSELDDESTLRNELLAAQMRFEEGEIDEEELASFEAEIMGLLREIRLRREEETGGLSGGARVVGVDVTVDAPGDSPNSLKRR